MSSSLLQSHSRRMWEVPQSLWRCLRFWAGCVLTLNSGRESSLLLSARLMARMRKGTCPRSRLCRSVSGCAVSQQRPHTGRHDTDPACTGGFGSCKGTPEKDEERSPVHRGAPAAFVFLHFPSQLNYLPPVSVWPHSCLGAQMLVAMAVSSSGGPKLCPKHTSAPRPFEHHISPKMG